MIYTLTMNPSLDYSMELEKFETGKTNRSKGEGYTLGGKGLNVSGVLAELGVASVAVCLVAGFVGEEIGKKLNSAPFSCRIIKIKEGNSRINVKLRGKVESEINARGPVISSEELGKVFEVFNEVKVGDTVVLSGSIPAGVDFVLYRELATKIKELGGRVIIDATGEALREGICTNPFLIKPNLAELEELFGRKFTNMDDIELCAKELNDQGVENVLVSMGDKGCMLVNSQGTFVKESKVDKVVSSVGAGDSMVAGFVAGYLKTQDYEYALKLAVSCARGTCSLEGLATKEIINEFMKDRNI